MPILKKKRPVTPEPLSAIHFSHIFSLQLFLWPFACPLTPVLNQFFAVKLLCTLLARQSWITQFHLMWLIEVVHRKAAMSPKFGFSSGLPNKENRFSFAIELSSRSFFWS